MWHSRLPRHLILPCASQLATAERLVRLPRLTFKSIPQVKYSVNSRNLKILARHRAVSLRFGYTRLRRAGRRERAVRSCVTASRERMFFLQAARAYCPPPFAWSSVVYHECADCQGRESCVTARREKNWGALAAPHSR